MILDFKNVIVELENNDADFVSNCFESILQEDQDNLEWAENEKLQQDLRQENQDREAKRLEMEKELKDKEIQLNFELEKLKIEKGVSHPESTSSNNSSRSTEVSLRKLIPEFNPEKTDIAKENWVSHLTALLPVDIISVIAWEDETEAENYDHIKKILLTKFKMNPERFRQKFVSHQKNPNNTWKDFGYEITWRNG